MFTNLLPYTTIIPITYTASSSREYLTFIAEQTPDRINYDISVLMERDQVKPVLFNELLKYERIADWIKKGDFSKSALPATIANDAIFVYLNVLMNQGERRSKLSEKLKGTSKNVKFPLAYHTPPKNQGDFAKKCMNLS